MLHRSPPQPKARDQINPLLQQLPKAAAQPDSTAADIATLKADFNALLAKLRAAGLLAP